MTDSGSAFPLPFGAPAVASLSRHSRRFTIDGSDRLERELERIRDEVRAAVLRTVSPGKVEAILLGGGYGRGEGGVLRTQAGDRPYNDLEFYVALRGSRLWNEQRYGAALNGLGHEFSLLFGLEVEFKIFSLRELRREPVTMFSYDLVMGHRWVYGDDRLLAGCEQHRNARQIPLAEATRLLFNRCSGLLFARERLDGAGFADDDADFVRRNLAKAHLALGDALLAAIGRYQWSCRERHRRLREELLGSDHPPWLADVIESHRAGMHFKLNPRRDVASRDSLREEHDRLTKQTLPVWLWIESRRLRRHFKDARDYALAPLDKCPERPAWRNWAVNLRVFGVRGFMRVGMVRYPRERLLNALVLLLWEPATTSDPHLQRTLQRQLNLSRHVAVDPISAYTRLWRRFR